jgi:site-specific DNA-methyltransferase (adenine-specific)
MGELVYDDGQVQLWHGDCRDVLPQLGVLDRAVCITDPPYEESSAGWDRWPGGWLERTYAALPADASLWCFGSFRLFLDRGAEFRAAGWRYGEDSVTELVWDKTKGTGPCGPDRLAKSHEFATHWYKGRWGNIHHDWPRVPRGHDHDKSAARTGAGRHRGAYGASTYVDDGLRRPTSLRTVQAPSVRFRARHQDEKPVPVVLDIARASVPPGGVLLDPMAGSGTAGEVAYLLGCRAVLIESDAASCEAAIQRLSACIPTLPEATG